MTQVAILPVPTGSGGFSYHAVAGDRWSRGKTAGEALDALLPQLGDQQSGPVIVIQSLQPDEYFNGAQQHQLSALMELWRAARDRGESLDADQQSLLEILVEAELRASSERATAIARELRK